MSFMVLTAAYDSSIRVPLLAVCLNATSAMAREGIEPSGDFSSPDKRICPAYCHSAIWPGHEWYALQADEAIRGGVVAEFVDSVHTSIAETTR